MKQIYFWILLFSSFCFGQESVVYTGFDHATSSIDANFIVGKWRIDEMISNSVVEDYQLFTSNNSNFYTSSLFFVNFKSDGTFDHYNSPKCGNGCIMKIKGKYKLINKDYICLFIDGASVRENCFGDKVNKKDLGMFRISKIDDRLILTKSDGNAIQDLQKIKYFQLLNEKRNEINRYYGTLFWIDWKSTSKNDSIEEAVDYCMKQNGVDEYEILYKSKSRYPFGMILVNIQGKYRYILYRKEFNMQIALYDDSFLDSIDHQKSLIDDQYLVESTISTIDHSDQNPLSKNSITYFKDNKKIKKIVFNQYTKDNGYFKYEYYIKDNTPFLLKIENSESKTSDFIILDWFSHSIVFKNPTRIIYEFYYIKNLFEYVLKVINKYEEK